MTVNVRTFSQSNDSAAIQAGLTAAAMTGNKLKIPAGDYICDTPIRSYGKSLSIEGDGVGSTRIIFTGEGWFDFRFNTQSQNTPPQQLHMRGMTIEARGDVLAPAIWADWDHYQPNAQGSLWLSDLNITRSPDGTPTITRTVELTGLKTDPRSLRLLDANQDGLLDVAVFTPLDSLKLFLQAKDGSFAEASAKGGFRKGLVDNLEASALSTGDLAGDGKAALLVSSGGFARALRVDEAGALTVIDQFNARDTTAEITASFVIPSPKGKRPEVLLYDRKGEQFQRLRANKQGVYEVADSVPAGRIDVVGSEVRPGSKGGKQPELFLLGKDRFWWLPLERGDFTARSVETYTTDLPEINYSDVIAGDLTGDGKLELVTLDPEKSVVEVLARDETAKAWVSRVHFKVFETDEHFQGHKGESLEPREAIIADVTGDGKKDLLLLVHDRILIYPQK